MQPLPVYILAGGRSSRFGSDKARAVFGGEPLIVRLAKQIQPVAREVTIVADVADKYADLGLSTIADLRPGLGPLGGIETALVHAQHPRGTNVDWCVIFSCDLTLIRPAWIELLAAGRRSDSLVAAFSDSRGRHPLPGLYHIHLLSVVRACLGAGRRALNELVDGVAHVDLPVPGDWPEVAQVNTLEDLKKAGE